MDRIDTGADVGCGAALRIGGHEAVRVQDVQLEAGLEDDRAGFLDDHRGAREAHAGDERLTIVDRDVLESGVQPQRPGPERLWRRLALIGRRGLTRRLPLAGADHLDAGGRRLDPLVRLDVAEQAVVGHLELATRGLCIQRVFDDDRQRGVGAAIAQIQTADDADPVARKTFITKRRSPLLDEP